MTFFKVTFFFNNDEKQHLEYFVEASDIVAAEKKAFEKLGSNGKKCKTSAEILPIVLDITLGKPGKKYENFKDQLADDPKMPELAFMYLRGGSKIRDDIKKELDKMFAPLGKEYQDQAMSTVIMMSSLAAIHDSEKYGKKPYLVDWLKEMKNK